MSTAFNISITLVLNLIFLIARVSLPSSIKKGIYISRFHYVNILNPMSVQLTGMTRDGTFLIEDGKLGRAIKNMRFNTSVVDMLKAVDMISKERQTKS